MKIKRINILAFMALIVLIMNNCTHDPNDIPTPKASVVTDNAGYKNTADSVCFSEQILPLLNSSCAQAGCHDDISREEGIILNSYTNTIATISGRLLMQVVQDKGPLGMPTDPAAKLNANQIAILQTWVNQGMKDGVDCLGPCDTTNVTYSTTIFSIIENSCLACHRASSGGTNLSDYTHVKASVDLGKFYCSITHGSGCSPMPQGSAALSNCRIKQIKKWIDSGAPNN